MTTARATLACVCWRNSQHLATTPELLVLKLYHKASQRLRDKYAEIRVFMADIFEENYRCYGYRRLHAMLRGNNKVISEKVVRRLIFAQNATEAASGLQACHPGSAHAGSFYRPLWDVVGKGHHLQERTVSECHRGCSVPAG